MYFLFVNYVKPDVNPDLVRETVPRHVDWVKTQINAGFLAQAGKWGEIGGAGIIRSDSLDQAVAILEQDPLITADLMRYECHPFYADVPID